MPLLPRPYPYYRKDSNTVYATAKTQDGRVLAILHATVIVETFTDDNNPKNEPRGQITLDHGGHHTPTTLRAINRTASAWGLGFEVNKIKTGPGYTILTKHGQKFDWTDRTITFSVESA